MPGAIRIMVTLHTDPGVKYLVHLADDRSDDGRGEQSGQQSLLQWSHAVLSFSVTRFRVVSFHGHLVFAAAIEYSPTTSNTAAPVGSNAPAAVGQRTRSAIVSVWKAECCRISSHPWLRRHSPSDQPRTPAMRRIE